MRERRDFGGMTRTTTGRKGLLPSVPGARGLALLWYLSHRGGAPERRGGADGGTYGLAGVQSRRLSRAPYSSHAGHTIHCVTIRRPWSPLHAQGNEHDDLRSVITRPGMHHFPGDGRVGPGARLSTVRELGG